MLTVTYITNPNEVSRRGCWKTPLILALVVRIILATQAFECLLELLLGRIDRAWGDTQDVSRGALANPFDQPSFH